MHLFIIHNFSDLDTLAPITYKLSSKTKETVKILSVYPVYDFTKYKLMKFLLSRNIKYYSLASINLKNRFLILFLKVLFFLPKFILVRLNALWHILYHSADLFTSNDICKFIEKEKIKCITIDDGLRQGFQKIFYDSSLKMGIQMIKVRVGVNLRKNFKISKDHFENCSKYILSENLMPDPEDINIKKKIIRILSARYCQEWLEVYEEINHFKLRDYKRHSPGKDKLKIVIFERPYVILEEWKKLEEKINLLGNVEVKLNIKPRGHLAPMHANRHFLNQFTSSEAINWADIVVSHISSVLVEAFLKKKKFFYLDYITKDKYKIARWVVYGHEPVIESYYFEDHSFFTKINSFDHLIKEITSFSKNIQNPNENELEDQKNFLKKLLGNQYENKDILDKYVNLYKDL